MENWEVMHSSKHSFLMKFLSRFSYPQKFVFISLLFAFSIIVCGFFMLRAQNIAIHNAKQEILGNLYQRHLLKLLENIPKHNLLTHRYLLGNKSVKAEMLTLESKINEAFKDLENINHELEEKLETTHEQFERRDFPNLQPEEINRKWIDLNKTIGEITPEVSDQEHQKIISDVYNLIQYIGETSNLSLDSGVDTDALIETTLVRLPRALVLIPQLIMKVEEITPQKTITENNIIELSRLMVLINTNIETTAENVKKAIAYDQNFQDDLETQDKLTTPLKLYVASVNDLMQYIQDNLIKPQEIQASLVDVAALGNKTINAAITFWDVAINQVDRLLNNRLNDFKWQQKFSVFMAFTSALAGFLVGILVMREISRPLNNLITASKQLATGDLSARVPVTYEDEVGEVGVAFNQMAESFQDLIGQLQWTGIQLTTSTTEIAATAKQQETTVVEQEATTKQIAATAREISATAKDFAKTMNEISGTAEQTSSLATSGKVGLTRMEIIMRQMVEAAGNIASKLAVLNEKAGGITSIVTTISKVADQTNLLSLNAAIEAEKAGEYGRSFAVIAREIRRLADQTGNATLDIEKMVNEMISAVSAGVMGVDKFSDEIHTGVKQAASVSDLLSKIIEQVQQLTSTFETVNQGMQAQSLSAEQINESITQLSEVAQQTTESIKQFHNAIEQLNNAAQDMQSAIAKIKR